jgi:hypothetical protein
MTLVGEVPRAALLPALIANLEMPVLFATVISSLPCDHLMRCTFFDNSSEGNDTAITPLAEIDKDKKLKLLSTSQPWWLKEYIIDPLFS